MLEDLENALAEHAPAGGELASELPPLTIDGIPVSVDKMTQVSHCALVCPISEPELQCQHVQQRAPNANSCLVSGQVLCALSRSETFLAL